MGHPNDSSHGSCFYVYPARGLEPVPRHCQPNLVKFARVDKNAIATADVSQEKPGIVYVERGGAETVDDESPLSFVADTVSNVAGQRVVLPSYMNPNGSL